MRLDDLLSQSGLESEFFTLSMGHRKIDLSVRSAAEVQLLSKSCTLALRSNLARLITGLNHRDFCIRLADSALLQWFLGVGRVDGVSTFAKSTSDRFAHFIDADSLQQLNAKLSERLQAESQLREGLKRRAGTEARISIIIRKFMGSPARAKGFEHREMMVGWAMLGHNLWKLARLEQAEQPPQIESAAA